MSRNPVAFVRMLTMASAVVLIVVSLAAIFAGVGPSGQTWAWIIGGTMFALSVLSLVVNMAFPGQSDCAWDEMNLAAHRASLVFGYWAAPCRFPADAKPCPDRVARGAGRVLLDGAGSRHCAPRCIS